MANDKQAETFTKKNKRQDNSLTKEINQLSSELHGKLNAIDKEAETLKKHSLIPGESQVYSGISYTPGKGSIEGLTTNESMLQILIGNDVRRANSTGSEVKATRPKSSHIKKHSKTKDKPGIDSLQQTNGTSKNKEQKIKSKSANLKAPRNILSVDNLATSQFKRRLSVDPTDLLHQRMIQRRSSHQYGSSEKLDRRNSGSSSSGSSDVFDPDIERLMSKTPRGRRMSLPSVLAPMNISSYVEDSGNSRTGSSALPFHGGPILTHIQTPATLYLRRLKSELDQRKPKTLAQLRANPKTTFEEEVEQDYIEAELHRRAVEVVGPRIKRQTDLTECRYLRRGSQDRELSIDEIFEKC